MYLSEKMTNKTIEQLRSESAEQQALAGAAIANLNTEKINLSRQQVELRQLQSAIATFRQQAVGVSPNTQQIIANNISALQQQIGALQNNIRQTNSRINNISTQAANYEASATLLAEEASQLLRNQITPPVPLPVEEPTISTESRPALKFLPPEFEFTTVIDTNPPIQSTTLIVPDPNEIQGPPAPIIPSILRQPTTQVFDDGSTITTNADGTPVNVTDSTDVIQNTFGNTILTGVALGGAALIAGNLLKKAPENIRDTVRVAAITGAVGLAVNAISSRGLTTNRTAAQASQASRNAQGTQNTSDWRVKLSLADTDAAKYLYNSATPGILQPLAATKGVIFPYVPNISVSYAAAYDPTDITHSNYKVFSYKQSSVDSVSIACDFTAQDTNEANYLLAVIHFFRSITKMFYGLDNNPKPGTPPPLCYLTGMGAFQFKNHPLVITNFTYSLPTDVDYIRATNFVTTQPGVSQARLNTPYSPSTSSVRLPGLLKPGGIQGPPQWRTPEGSAVEPTYIPTKMSIQLQALPIVTRGDISRGFSLAEYASGKIYKGVTGTNNRGIW